MNKICGLLVRQTIRNNQLSGFNKFVCFSTAPVNTVPLSKNPKHKTSPKVTLISPEDKIEITTLDQAKKIAERRQLKLVSIMDFDTKTNRAVYKLMTGAQYHEEEIKKREEKKESRKEQHLKSEKLLTLSSKISEHDLNSKISKCIKWIAKLHEIRVVVSGDESEPQKTEKIVATIEKEVVPLGGRILQKRVKDGVIKFSIMPTIKKEHTETPITPAPKKLLEPENLPAEAHVRSVHTMAF